MSESQGLLARAAVSRAAPIVGACRRHIAVVAVVLAALVLVAGLATYLHWRDNARELVEYEGLGTKSSGGQVGRTIYFDSNISPNTKTDHQRLDIRRIRPTVTKNTADAAVAVFICSHNPGDASMGDTDTLRPYCVAERLFTPGPLDLGRSVNQVIYAVTAHRSGTVQINGAEVSYDIGSRHGTQHAGFGVIDYIR